jgi:trk system potassium uptake protein TrkA
MVVGCGRWGAGLAQALSLQHHTVTVIDRDPAAFERLPPAFSGRKIAGSCFEQEVLQQANIDRIDGLAALTGSDDINIAAARLARQVYRVPKTVARLYDPLKAEAYERLGLQTISPVTWGINRIKDVLLFSPLGVTCSLGDGHVDIVEVELPALLADRHAEDITLPGEVHLVAITRGGATMLPMPGMAFKPGDRLHLAARAASVERLKHILALT